MEKETPLIYIPEEHRQILQLKYEAYFKERENRRKQEAQYVFQALQEFNSHSRITFERNPVTNRLELCNRSAEALNAEICHCLNSQNIAYFIELVLENSDAAKTMAETLKANERARLSDAAHKRHEKDPKQAQKASVQECWDAWKKEPSRYKSKAAFARDMLQKFEHLESVTTIERWCRKWEHEASLC